MSATTDMLNLVASTVQSHPALESALYRHRVEGPGGKPVPMSLRLFPFQIGILLACSKAERAIISKCVQVGCTESALLIIAHQVGVQGRRGAFILPTQPTVRDFAQDKWGQMVLRSPSYRSMGRQVEADGNSAVENIRLRRFGAGMLRFVNSNVEGELVSFTADTIVVEEHDQCNQKNLAKVPDRLMAGHSPQYISISNPSALNGIETLYEDTDQRRWHHKCNRCGEWQVIDWFDNFIHQNDAGIWVPRDADRYRWVGGDGLHRKVDASRDIRPMCQRCGEPMERQAMKAEWVARFPARHWVGFTFSQTDVPTRMAWNLYRKYSQALKDPDMMRAFYTGVLGRLYKAPGMAITDAMLQDALGGRPNDPTGGSAYTDKQITMGVDINAMQNVTITELMKDGRRVARFVGAVKTFKELRGLVKRFHVNTCAVDAQPETTAMQEFRQWCRDNTDCMVWLVRWGPKQQKIDPEHPWGLTPKPDAGQVHVDKTAVLDRSMTDIDNGTRVFPADALHIEGFVDQMKDTTRHISKDGTRYEWSKGKRDDYRCADTYDLIAAYLHTKFGRNKARLRVIDSGPSRGPWG